MNINSKEFMPLKIASNQTEKSSLSLYNEPTIFAIGLEIDVDNATEIYLKKTISSSS